MKRDNHSRLILFNGCVLTIILWMFGTDSHGQENSRQVLRQSELATVTDFQLSRTVEEFSGFDRNAIRTSFFDNDLAPLNKTDNGVRELKATRSFIKTQLRPIGRNQAAISAFAADKTPERMWGVLKAVEDERDYKAAAILAENMLRSESDQTRRDLLHLVCARNQWITRAGKPLPSYHQHINLALESTDQSISQEAYLWKQAVTAPETLEELLLTRQIWLVKHMERGHREDSVAMTSMIAGRGRAIYESMEGASVEDKYAVLAVVSEAAFQSGTHPLLKWAIDEAARLPPRDDLEMAHIPAFFSAHLHFATSNYDQAIREFEPLMFSNVQTKLVMRSADRISHCYAMKHDMVAAIAVLEVAREAYPQLYEETVILKNRENRLKQRTGAEPFTIASRKNELFGTQLAQLLETQGRVEELQAKSNVSDFEMGEY